MKTHSRSRARRGVLAALGGAGCALALALLPASAPGSYVNYPDFSRTGGLQLNGSAKVVGGTLRLTDAQGQAGSVFTDPNVIDPTQTLRSSFTFHAHDGTADGFTFAVQRDSRGASALGASGAALGYGNGNPDGIKRSVAVEFDLYPDDSIFEDHVSILTGGETQTQFGGAVQIAPAIADIYGGTRYAWIDYKPKTRKLSVFVSDTAVKPAAPLTSATVNLKKELGGSGRAGFTAGTGGEYAVQDIESWKVEN